MLDDSWPLELRETAVVRPHFALVAHRQIKQSVDGNVHNDLCRAEPGPTRALRIDPNVVDLFRSCGNRASDGDFGRLHFTPLSIFQWLDDRQKTAPASQVAPS